MPSACGSTGCSHTSELGSSAAFAAHPEVQLQELHTNASQFNLVGAKQQGFHLELLTPFPSFSEMDYWGPEPTKSGRAASTKAFFVHFLELKSERFAGFKLIDVSCRLGDKNLAGEP